MPRSKVKSKAEALTASRKPTHGAFESVAAHVLASEATMSASPNWNKISDVRRMALKEIHHKIARILCGDPDHADHWDDIGGYAELGKKDGSPVVVARMPRKPKKAKKVKVRPARPDRAPAAARRSRPARPDPAPRRARKTRAKPATPVADAG